VNNPWPALIVAVILVLIGAAMMASHVVAWRRQQSDPTLEQDDRDFYRRRYRRRMQISGTFAILGVLIGLGDALLPQQGRHPWPITFYVIGLLLLTGWVLLLGIAEFLSTAARGRVELARIRQKQSELERQVVEFKHRNLADHDEEDSP
jgi:MFS family permease